MPKTKKNSTVSESDIATELQLHKSENRNSTWIGGVGTWVVYVALLIITIVVLNTFFPEAMAWTVWNVGHNVVSLISSSR